MLFFLRVRSSAFSEAVEKLTCLGRIEEGGLRCENSDDPWFVVSTRQSFSIPELRLSLGLGDYLHDVREVASRAEGAMMARQRELFG